MYKNDLIGFWYLYEMMSIADRIFTKPLELKYKEIF
jgi:hypothetical protein